MWPMPRIFGFLAPAFKISDLGIAETPIRAELFSTERLEQHAASLAAAQTVLPQSMSKMRRFLPERALDNERILLKCYDAIAQATFQRRFITPAAEWLLDNFRVIEGQFSEIRQGLNTPTYRKLPKLASGPLRGYPRIYGVMWAFVAHTDSHFNASLLKSFLQAYQQVEPLSIAELWSIPLTLRAVMTENLRRVCVDVAGTQAIRQQADKLADDLLTLDHKAPQEVGTVLHDLSTRPLARAFAVQLIQRLRYQDISLHWLTQELANQGQTVEEIVQREHASQASSNMTVRNLITSMRDMWLFDWQPFFEEVSLVEKSLRRNTIYSSMDFTTRDRYRHAIETLARGSSHSELDIANAVLNKAANNQHHTTAASQNEAMQDRRSDPGYYLISTGRRDFEKEIDFHVNFKQRCLRAYTAHAATAYISTILVISAALLALPMWLSFEAGVSLIGLCVLGVLGLFPASDIATFLINSLLTRLVEPNHLARLELENGIPTHLRTFVVVPTLLTTKAGVLDQIDQLEVHYLANPKGDIRFALLSDWADADTESEEQDMLLLNTAIEKTAALNARYGAMFDGEPRFFLFHRKRIWNEAQHKWLSWERKRGKLHEFNRLLRGATDTSFIPINGVPACTPKDVRYVITLDSDTRLPLDAVRKLVGTAAHPLNRPRIDPRSRRVVEGYGVLQPRITPELPTNKDGSAFQRIFSGPCGVDPYAGAISNIYQDMFGEGCYTGKGIYDVEAFESALADRIPENAILSHDLFEGIFARCGLVSDIELFEDFPAHYQVAASRSHRWIRGDWQLLPWIIGLAKEPIPGMGRWKMIDNLRRSLSAPVMALALLASWAIPHTPAAIWTAFILFALSIPALLSLFRRLILRNGISPKSHLQAVGNELLLDFSHVAMDLVLLAHRSWLALDAIGRTLFRLLISHHLLLEWITAAQAKKHAGATVGSFIRFMRGAIITALIFTAIIAYFNFPSLAVAAPILILWCLSPFIAQLVSRSSRIITPKPSNEDVLMLRLVGRRIWRFFTTFVSQQDHYLPPDNFQEDPQPAIAHRSSPTNFGLYLLSTLSARDFGWIGVTEMMERLEATLDTLKKLPRYRGHFFNWYNTQDLTVLEPKYISTVDSGNLAGHLLALASGCREIIQQPIFTNAQLEGVRDSAWLLKDAIQAEREGPRTLTVNLRQLYEGLNDLEQWLVEENEESLTHAQWSTRWSELGIRATTLLDLAQTFAEERGNADQSEVLAWASAIESNVSSHLRDLPLCASPLNTAVTLNERLGALAKTAESFFNEMKFDFLYDPARRLFAIGYLLKEAVLDNSYYDLLASEARLASFIAIAKGDVAADHWFRMGRPLTPQGNGAVLMSWSGSMFEYLMPSLVMYTPRHSLLDQTCRLAVARQITYGRDRRVPWGVSESAYNARDRSLTYQYAAFGVPGLGLKRGLAQNLVVAPYATALAAMYDTPAAIANFQQLEVVGGRGIFGFYDAIDFTATRLPENCSSAPVRTYMAHHQGMSLIALGNVLFDGVMRHRFHRQLIVRAADLLLQEPKPREYGIAHPHQDTIEAAFAKENIMPVTRRFHSARQPIPASHLLSNGSYSVMVTTAGSGYSSWDGLAVTRWREDATCDAWGSYLFLRDTANGQTWSATYQPLDVEPDRYEVIFSEDRARIIRNDGTLTTSLEILVSPEDNAEIRRLTITNSGPKPREIEATSYAEIVLAAAAADTAHPAFSNLFIQTEYLPEIHGLLAMRRPRSSTDTPVWAAHILAAGGTYSESIGYETDRTRFLGRGCSIRNPVAIMDGRPLSNTVGSVLDPVLSLRTRIDVAAGATVYIVFATMVAETREQIINLADKYRDPGSFERISTLAWTQGQVTLHHLGITAEEALLFQYLANRALYLDPNMRPGSDTLKRNTLNVTALWRYSISGDFPIILLRVDDPEDREIVRQLLRAHEYWHSKGLSIDLVILNERQASYMQDFQTSLEEMVRGSQASYVPDTQHGQVFVLRADLLVEQELDLLRCVARVALLGGKQGSLDEQVVRMRRADPKPAPVIQRLQPPHTVGDTILATPKLEFFNGLGGFAEHGSEYVTVLGQDQRTPAPWINIIANPDFGFQVSESGAGYTWAHNSQANQLTTWSNDPVSDSSSEVFYLRDLDSGALWTPTALPIRIENTRYIARHGRGYTRFQHAAYDIGTELLQFVSWDDAIKISTLTIENQSAHTRKLSVTSYVEWVLGTSRAANAPFIVTEMDETTGAMFAYNPWNAEFENQIVFVDWVGRQSSWTADRTEFIGRNGGLEQPAALSVATVLSSRVGAGLDPCSALQTEIELTAGQRIELTFILGQAHNRQEARTLIGRYRRTNPSDILSKVTKNWNQILTTVQVKTPDRASDLMLNGWLLYQVLACRMWARTAFYQASGAYGFRDQLQDSMALNLSRPDITREHLLRAAGRQFAEGDIQHWWHPPSGRGVRTHMSDDRLWLPYVVAQYVTVTGDQTVLDETIPFIEGAAVAPDQENAYYTPTTSSQSGTLYEHCVLAINCSLKTGAHGLPLMGGGDWNDGMNRVGHEGKGESVWLGWFLISTIAAFSPLASARNDQTNISRWGKHALELKAALKKNAWDGAWYRRAYFDDGTPLGSSTDEECRIDSIAQSWSVISGAADTTRQHRAMQSVEQHLLRQGDDLLLLLTPPFDKTQRDPGYIKGYLPGVRENGGQYTHAAVWCVIAYTLLGDGNKAGELFKMLNPINHASTRAGVHAYKVEPYVVAGDIYSASGHVRRGGWTWYTGSAGWLYRSGIESLLGLKKQGDTLLIDPCIPPDWPSFDLNYRHNDTLYLIKINNPQGVAKGVVAIELDDVALPSSNLTIPLTNDGNTHQVSVLLGDMTQTTPASTT